MSNEKQPEKQPFEHYPSLAEKLLHAAHFWKTDDTWSSTLAEINIVCSELNRVKNKSEEDERIMEQIRTAHKMLDENGSFKRLEVTNLYVIVDAGANVIGDRVYTDAAEAKLITDKNWLGSHFVVRLDAHLSALHSWFEKGVDDLLRD